MKYRIAVNPRLVPKGTGTLARAIAQCGLPDACEIIHSGRNVVARMANEGLVLKAYKVPGLVKGLIYRWLRQPKSRRAYANAQRLIEMGINTPEPAFAIECYSRTTGLRESYYACTDLSDWTDMHDVEKRSDFRKIAKALAAFIFKMHTESILMNDMNPGNILFREENGTYSFALVDINRMEFGVREWGRLLENFRALLDTEDGTAAVAEEYYKLLTGSGVKLIADDFVGDMRRSYRQWIERQMRQRRFKAIFSKKHRHGYYAHGNA